MAHICRLYIENINQSLTNDEKIIIKQNINSNAYHHALNVMRLKDNDTVEVFNGKDNFYAICKIISISHKLIELLVCQIITPDKEQANAIQKQQHILALCVIKKEQMEEIIRTCTEIGIDEIIFIKSQHSQSTYINFERLNDIAISAAMQCKINVLPTINKQINPIEDFLSKANGVVLFANETLKQQQQKANNCNAKIQKMQNTYILIGPEGGFAANEVELILKQRPNINTKQISLGKNILRSSTAAAVACFGAVNNMF